MTRTSLTALLEERGLLEAGTRFTADLHLHSTISDGSDELEDIMRAAANSGLTHVALTNHDTTYGLTEASHIGAEAGVCVIGGIEVSAYDPIRDRKVHIIGLDMREESPALAELCAPTLAARDANTRWQLERLIEAGYTLDEDKLKAHAERSTCLYKQHLMAALTSAPYSSDSYRKLYRSLFKDGGICDRDITYVDARDAVSAIIEDGGLPVLAHPGQFDSWDLVAELVDCGLAGIEAIHPEHRFADETRARAMAEKYGLFISGGSDYHGAFGKAPCVGFLRIHG